MTHAFVHAGRWLILAMVCGMPLLVEGAITPAQRKELAELQREVRRIDGLVRRKELDEASTLCDEIERRLQAVVDEAMLPASDRGTLGIRRLLEGHRAELAKLRSGVELDRRAGEPVLFSRDVAPILVRNCLRCHGADPSGGLRLDTFAGMRQGGEHGTPVVVGNAAQSGLVARLMAPEDSRMPQEAEALAAKDIQTIATWINQGAKFDGTNPSARVVDLARASGGLPTIDVPRATGSEKVSFTKDIAPSLVGLCFNCHSGNTPRGGLSMVDVQSLMEGGASGQVVLPGQLEESRLWRLVGGLENPRMPQGQGRITRKFYADLRTWIQEGAKYDGPSPTTPLRDLVPTAAQTRAAELAGMSPDQFAAHRRQRTGELFQRTLPRGTPEQLETDEVLLYGDVSAARLKEIGEWADEQARSLREGFDSTDAPLWKGKLAILIFKDRFGYVEFNHTIPKRETAADEVGQAVVTDGQDDAYIVLQDVGDASNAATPSLRLSLVAQMSGAFFERSGDLPDWIVRGSGIALAAKRFPGDSYLGGLHGRARVALAPVVRPEQIFRDGTFSPADVGPVGYTLVEYLLATWRADSFRRFVAQLQSGQSNAAALQAVYRTDEKTLATAYGRWMSRGR